MTKRMFLEKKLSYRLNYEPGSEALVADAMAEHWNGFEWVSGPVIVTWKSDTHGQVQVWAVSEEEGKGVIQHALAHMGADEDAGTYLVGVSSNPRFGKVATVRATFVQARTGASGAGEKRFLAP
jgi:hypothetical protein